jgi:uncharacterized protein (TIGR03435 family)
MAKKARLIAVAILVILAPRGGPAQSAPRRAFEVTAIKPNKDCGAPGRGSGGQTSPGRISLICAQLRDLILTAYGIYADNSDPSPLSFRMQVVGGPAWIDSDRFDLAAKAEGNPTPAQMYGPMLRALLEDRFNLKVHRQTKQAPVYVLTIAKGGPKLHPSRNGSCVSTDIDHPLPPPDPAHPGPPACGSQTTGPDGAFDMYGATIANLCTQLSIRLDRNLLDKTGITGTYDIHLDVSPADLAPRFLAGGSTNPQADPLTAGDSAGPSIFTALHQLGLNIQSAKGPVDFLVVDRVQRPAAN